MTNGPIFKNISIFFPANSYWWFGIVMGNIRLLRETDGSWPFACLMIRVWQPFKPILKEELFPSSDIDSASREIAKMIGGRKDYVRRFLGRPAVRCVGKVITIGMRKTI
jgi:hypothetical protein